MLNSFLIFNKYATIPFGEEALRMAGTPSVRQFTGLMHMTLGALTTGFDNVTHKPNRVDFTGYMTVD